MDREMNFFDLCVAFFRAIGRGCKAVVNLLAKMIRLTYRQWWIVLIVIAVALVLANIYAGKENRKYKVEAVVVLNGPTLELTEQVYRHLNEPVSEKIYAPQSLQALLNLTKEDLEGVSKFDIFPIIDCHHDSIADYVDYRKSSSSSDTSNIRMPNRVCIQFVTKNLEKAPMIEDALLTYLNSNPAMIRAFEHKRQFAERKAKFARDHVEKLDSLTSAFYFNQSTGQQAQAGMWEKGFVLGRREIKLFHPAIYAEIDHLVRLDYDLMYCTAPVVLENDFVINPHAVNSPLRMSAMALLLGWLLGCIIAAIVEQRRNILDWLKQ